MGMTVVDLFASLPPPEVRALVETALRRRADFKSARDFLDRALDAALSPVAGFRKPHAAPVTVLSPLVCGACVDSRWLPLAIAITKCWGDIHADDTQEAIRLVRDAGLEPTTLGSLSEAFGTWQPGQLEKIVGNFLRGRPGLSPRLSAFLACVCAGRYADLREFEAAPIGPEVGSAPVDDLAPLWRRTLGEAEGLPPDSAEWSSIDAFVESLRDLEAKKAGQAEKEEAAATAEAELKAALLQMRAVPPSVVAFFDLNSTVAEWLDPAACWQSRSAAATRITQIAGILTDAEPLTRPAATLSERRKQVEPLEAVERRLRSATEDLERLLKEAASTPPALALTHPNTRPSPLLPRWRLLRPRATTTRGRIPRASPPRRRLSQSRGHHSTSKCRMVRVGRSPAFRHRAVTREQRLGDRTRGRLKARMQVDKLRPRPT